MLTKRILVQEIESLLLWGAIEQRKRFYTKYFLIPNTKAGWRHILDFQQLTTYVHRLRFRMVALVSVILSLNRDDWFMGLYMKEAGFHMDIHPITGDF